LSSSVKFFWFLYYANLSEESTALNGTTSFLSLLLGPLAETMIAAMKLRHILATIYWLFLSFFVSLLGFWCFILPNSVIPAAEQKYIIFRKNIGQ